MYIYPVKACAGIRLTQSLIGAHGLLHDRMWMLISPDDRFITQREAPQVARIQPSFDRAGHLCLQAPGMSELTIAPAAGASTRQTHVDIWGSRCLAQEQGADAAKWLSEFLRRPCQLVRMPPDFSRYASAPFDPLNRALQGFVDSYPILLISSESLQDLNRRMEQPVRMDRFRPNFVVTGGSPYAEDTWRKVQIGSVTFSGAQTCARCVVTTIDPVTLKFGKEPLHTLSQYRKIDRSVRFGQYLIHEQPGTVALGDALAVLATLPPA